MWTSFFVDSFHLFNRKISELERRKRKTNRKSSGNTAHVWHFLLDPQPWIMVESYIHCSANIFTFHCKVCDTLQNCDSVMVHLNRWTWMDLKLSNCYGVEQTFKRESETNTGENICSDRVVQQRQIYCAIPNHHLVSIPNHHLVSITVNPKNYSRPYGDLECSTSSLLLLLLLLLFTSFPFLLPFSSVFCFSSFSQALFFLNEIWVMTPVHSLVKDI